MTETLIDKVALTERRRQFSDRLDELRQQTADRLADIAAAETDWVDAVERGEDAELLAERVELRKREAAATRRAVDHLAGILADLDRQLAEIEASEQLDSELTMYAEQLAGYRGRVDDLPGAPIEAARAVQGAVSALRTSVTAARQDHEAMAAQAARLRAQAAQLGRETAVPDPPDWSAVLQPAEHGGPAWIMYLALVQGRSDRDLLDALWRLATVSSP